MSNDTFLSHLLELRDRLLRAIIAVVIVFAFLFPFANDIYSLLAQPLLAKLPKGGQMIATEVTTPFLVPIKLAMLSAVVLSLPYLLYQLWAFVAPALYTQEKRLAVSMVVASTLLFLCGMSFAYFLVLPVVFGFITSVAPAGVAVMTDINKYLDFVIGLFMAFGLTFEVPVAVVLLVKMDMVSVAKLKEIRPYIFVGAFVIGAIFTPPDVVSQIMLAVPLWLLYEAGIVVATLIKKRQATADEAEYRPLNDIELEQELDNIEAAEKTKLE